MNKFNKVICVVSALLVTVSCAVTQGKTYAYRTIHEDVLRSEMGTMASSLGKLANLYFDTTITDEHRYDVVHKELDTIKRVASRIGGDEVVTNYSIINRYMGAFLYDVSIAKEFAEKNPPNYVPANRLLNSCLACHAEL